MRDISSRLGYFGLGVWLRAPITERTDYERRLAEAIIAGGAPAEWRITEWNFRGIPPDLLDLPAAESSPLTTARPLWVSPELAAALGIAESGPADAWGDPSRVWAQAAGLARIAGLPEPPAVASHAAPAHPAALVLALATLGRLAVG